VDDRRQNDEVTAHRLDAVERALRVVQSEAVSQRWLDERFERLGDQVRNLADDIKDIRQGEKARRLAVYAALATGVVSLVSALVIVAVTGQVGA
jgi:type IV secretory pathway component VirB8